MINLAKTFAENPILNAFCLFLGSLSGIGIGALLIG